MAPVTAPAAEHKGCELTLAFADGKRLSAHACILAAASPVLRDCLRLSLPQTGELRLDDAGEDWEVVLPMLQLKFYPRTLVTWDNLEALLRLAEKYDMAVVKGYATDFMARKASAMSLKEPLVSPRNPLRAATLVGTFCCTPELKPFTSVVEAAVDSALASLRSAPGDPAVVGSLADSLKPLLEDPKYHLNISPAVQAKVSLALLAAVKVKRVCRFAPCSGHTERPKTGPVPMSAANDQLAKALLDPVKREVLWPVVFAGVKNVVRSNNLNNETLTCVKGWLKSTDSSLQIPLLSLTVLHTMALNSGVAVRNQMAVPKLFGRLEKQLAKPPGPLVASAILQVLVDWQHLFGHEDLGARSRAVLASPRYSGQALSYSPSPAVVAMEEEMRLGVPPVAPIRGEDFVKWLQRGASIEGSSFSGPPGGGPPQAPLPQGGQLPGGTPPPITVAMVPQLCQRMQADAGRLTAALGACRAAARSGRMGELTSVMDGGYREAERCSQWRRRVQEFTQRCDVASALSSVLAATDVANKALEHWQTFTSQEVYGMMRIAVPPMPPEPLTSSEPANRRAGAGPGAGANGGAASGTARPRPDIDELLGMAGPVPTPAGGATGAAAVMELTVDVPPGPVPSANPFAAAVEAARPPVPTGASVPRPIVAQAGRAASHQPQPSLSDWDPFGPPSAPARTGGGGGGGGPGAGPGPGVATGPWAVFGDEPMSAGRGPAMGSINSPYSPAVSTTSAASGLLPSPAASVASGSSPLAFHGDGATSAPTPSLHHQAASTPGPVATAASAPAVTGRPSHPMVSASSSPQLFPNGVVMPSGLEPSGGGGHGQVPMQRSSTQPRQPAAPVPAAPAPVARPAGPSGGGAASNGTSTAAAAAGALDWRPEFDRLTADLRSLAATSGPMSGGGAAGGLPLAAVMSRVQGLCEALAAQHAKRVAALDAQHAAEVLDIKSRALRKLREVTGGAPAPSPTTGASAAAAPRAPNGAGGSGDGGVTGTGAGAGARGIAVGHGPLQAGLAYAQHQHQQPHKLPFGWGQVGPGGAAGSAAGAVGAQGQGHRANGGAGGDFSLI
ncbi:hypothetical protein HYH03_001907 [Edaphochlamys debaryana]|uniref:BTB domain-containing protein n=1 Tax=Edaphochlamys debaryana TaxID=47281 RepID=A0A835YG65_9CHLO|nr:hypothetical protein HYH03_001907 [Edaphochlamys debaryana]|eukprot:KAG2500331.1 hypothetical protein HYH03_001907 [Edaphochlamys debaryana]